jgi:hypothetical protein
VRRVQAARPIASAWVGRRAAANRGQAAALALGARLRRIPPLAAPDSMPPRPLGSD